MIEIRTAEPTDAGGISEVLIASIVELCSLDHQDDPTEIAGWIENKTPENIALWIESPQTTLDLAIMDDGIAGVGGWSAGGEILLNYVSPKHRFKGVSARLLAHMERELFKRDVFEGRLTSTRTAHQFYRAAGWLDDGDPSSKIGMIEFPMKKELRPD